MPTAPDHTGTCYLDPDAVEAHVRACTEAEITAGFHVIGDAAVATVVNAFERVVADLGPVAVARCGHRLEHVEMVNADQAAKAGSVGRHRQRAAQFRRAYGAAPTACTRGGSAPSEAVGSTPLRC